MSWARPTSHGMISRTLVLFLFHLWRQKLLGQIWKRPFSQHSFEQLLTQRIMWDVKIDCSHDHSLADLIASSVVDCVATETGMPACDALFSMSRLCWYLHAWGSMLQWQKQETSHEFELTDRWDHFRYSGSQIMLLSISDQVSSPDRSAVASARIYLVQSDQVFTNRDEEEISGNSHLRIKIFPDRRLE